MIFGVNFSVAYATFFVKIHFAEHGKPVIVSVASLRKLAVFLLTTHLKKIKDTAKAMSFILVGEGGFEPPKAKPADLQSVPFGHSGTLPNPTTTTIP